MNNVSNQKKYTLVADWLFTISFMIILMVIVGGITRLTGSGLSITEWKPISGILPPLSLDAWQNEFEAYKKIPQFSMINPSMTLDEFKNIFWWEWGHRFLGRIIGIAFFVPMVFFWIRNMIPATYKPVIIALFIGGGLQGLVGWLMVKSGLTDRVSVSQYRLAMHLGLALILYYCVLHTSLCLKNKMAFSLPKWSPVFMLTLLVFTQIISGAFTAGTHAGYIYNTWPLIDGFLIPQHLFPKGFISLFEDILTIQFTHRNIAYLIVIISLYVSYDYIKKRNLFAAMLLSSIIFVQVSIGIFTLVTIAAIDHIELAAFHQFMAVIVLTVCCYLSFKCSFKA